MECECGAKNCRKKVRDFKCLDKEIQEKYIALGIVPEYIVDKNDVEEIKTLKQKKVPFRQIEDLFHN